MKSRFCSTRITVRPRFARSVGELLGDRLDDRGLDALGRLVEQQQARRLDQAAGERQELLLAARERAPCPLQQRLQPRELLQHLLDRAGSGTAFGGEREAQIVEHREPGEDLAALGHVAEAAARALVAGARVMSSPARRTRPAVAGRSPISVLSSVVLPMPLWPRMPMNSPSSTARLMPVSTGTAP